MHIDWPQGIYLALMVSSWGIALSRYGELKKDSYDIVDVLVGPVITTGLLYWGGFFA